MARLISGLAIEKTLMRPLKNTNCLYLGSGITKDMQNRYVLSAPVTSEYNSAIQDFIELAYTSSPQHTNSTEARITRDAPDLEKNYNLLTLHS
ncbi:hypothetical protein DPMN_025996 [Dreissena polymorpha]|uniref:Uncharacterized protein n=1 Tax=Dreissena polymorpha TaxID=45954 RepID=A0A9D4LRQ5_DREPO|nr:hypothetical protein DPMN_025996 [Dreissena polymorpha]